MALTLGMTFCHVMEIPGKLRLDGVTWLTVQQNLYGAFGVVGAAIELLSILLTWVVAVQVRHRRPAFLWTVAAGLFVTVGLAVWFAVVAPEFHGAGFMLSWTRGDPTGDKLAGPSRIPARICCT